MSDVTYEIDPASSDAVSFGQVLGARGDVNYEESGSIQLPSGILEVPVTFLWEKETADYRFEYCYVEDSNSPPEDIRAVVNSRSTTGFTVQLSAAPDTNESVLRWHVITPDGLHLTQPPTSQPRYVLAGEFQSLSENLTALSGLVLTAYGLGLLELVDEAGAISYLGAQAQSDQLDAWSLLTPSATGLNFIGAAPPGVTSFLRVTAGGALNYLTSAEALTELGALQGVNVTGNNGITVAGSGTDSITLGLGTITPTGISMAAGDVTLGEAGAVFNLYPAPNTATTGMLLANVANAASGLQRYSPAFQWHGIGWKTNPTAGGQSVDFRAYVVPVQGVSSPSGYFTIENAVNNGAFGGALNLFTSGGLALGSTADPGTGSMTIPSGLAVGINGISPYKLALQIAANKRLIIDLYADLTMPKIEARTDAGSLIDLMLSAATVRATGNAEIAGNFIAGGGIAVAGGAGGYGMSSGGDINAGNIQAEGYLLGRMPSMADASAAANTIYFSTDANKLVYKDFVSVVQALY